VMTDVKTYDPPAALRAVLRDVHRMIVHQRPYEEVAATLDAAAALPHAADLDAAALIARERHATLWRYAVSDEEVARVLAITATELETLPTSERASLLQWACSGRQALAERYLAPLLAELEERAPDSTGTIEQLRAELSIGRGELQPVEEEEDEEGDEKKFPEEFIDGIRYAYRLRRMGWPYEDVIAVLDEVGTLPSAAEFAGQLAVDRIVVTSMFRRPDEDMEREIERALQAEAESPAWIRAMTVMNACDGRLTLAERYMPELIADAETELREHPDEVAQQYLNGVKIKLERTRAGG
jgi:hypothetical protein